MLFKLRLLTWWASSGVGSSLLLILCIGNEDLIIVYVVILPFGVTGSSHKMLYCLHYVLYCTLLYCTVLYCTVLYCIDMVLSLT